MMNHSNNINKWTITSNPNALNIQMGTAYDVGNHVAGLEQTPKKNEAGLNRLMENEIEQHEPYKTWRATQVVQKIKEVLVHYRHPTVV